LTFGSSIKQFVESIMLSARIISPRFSDYQVSGFDFYSESGQMDDILRADIVQIIKDEISFHLTKVGEGDGTDGISEGTNLESKIKSNVLKGVSVGKDPIGAVTSALKGVPLPHAALVALALALIPIIFKELTRDGGTLDLRWKRIIDNEVNGFLDRQTQRNTQIGTRQVIIQSRAGFIAINGAAGNENTIRQIRDGGVDGNRLAQIDITDHSRELFQ